jgi:hypothetical protein
MRDGDGGGERRESPRVQSIHLVTVETEGPLSLSPVEVGRTLDASATGVRLETSVAIPPGKRVRLEIALGEKVVAAEGRVIRVEASSRPGLHEVGVELLDVDPEVRSLLLGDG